MIWIVSGIALGVLILVLALVHKDRKNSSSRDLSDRTCRILMIILFTCFAFILFFKVTEIPTAFNVDEAASAYDALSLAKYHCDRFLYRFPVYFVNFGGGQNALYTYLVAGLIIIFGYSALIVRLPAVILSLLSAMTFSWVIRKEYGNSASVIMAFFFCILPFSIMHSRWGLESYLLFPMLIFSAAALLRAVRSGKTRWFILAGILFGVSLYSYSVSYLLLPLFLGITLLYLLSIKKIRWKDLLAIGLPIIIAAIPLLLFLAVNNGYIEEIRTHYFSVPKLKAYRGNEIRLQNVITNLAPGSYNIFYSLFVNDRCTYNIVPKFGSLYYFSIPFILYGFVLCLRNSVRTVRNRAYSLDLTVTVLFAVTFVVSLFFEGINANRGCALYIGFMYFLMVGIYEILKKNKTYFIISSAVYLVLFSCFMTFYIKGFPSYLDDNTMFGSIDDLKESLLFADTVNRYDDTIYVLDRGQPYIYTLLALDIDPFTFNKNLIMANDNYVKVVGKYRFRLDAIMPECVYICRDLNRLPEGIESFGFDKKQFGSVVVYYPPAD